MDYLRQIAKHPDLVVHDCIVVYISSHGESGGIICSHGLKINFEEILDIFSNINCDKLKAKHKIFFFNCCRGFKIEYGTTSAQIENPDSNDNTTVDMNVLSLSDHHQMAICFSTMDGFVSMRNIKYGTWFGQALAKALDLFAPDYDLGFILQITSEILYLKNIKYKIKQKIETSYIDFSKFFFQEK